MRPQGRVLLYTSVFMDNTVQYSEKAGCRLPVGVRGKVACEHSTNFRQTQVFVTPCTDINQ